MKLDLSQALLTPDDSPMQEAGQIVTMGHALKRAILDSPDNIGSKTERFELFLKLKSGAADYSPSEVALLDKAVAFYPTLICGQLNYFLAGKSTQGN